MCLNNRAAGHPLFTGRHAHMTGNTSVGYGECRHHNLPEPNIDRTSGRTGRTLNLPPLLEKIFLYGRNYQEQQHASA
jgi:hypothetical protein